MRVLLAILTLVLAPVTAAAQDDPLVEEMLRCEGWYQSKSQPGTEVVACDQAQMDAFGDSGLTAAPRGGAAIKGPGGDAVQADPPTVYHDSDPTRLARVRVIGRGTDVGVFATRFDRQGLLMEAQFGPVHLPDGVPLTIALAPEGAVLARADTGAVVATATTSVVRLDAPTRTPLSSHAVERVARACLDFRDGVYWDPLVPRRQLLRQLSGLAHKRTVLAVRLRRAARTAGDRRLLVPLARSLRRGNRHFRAIARTVRRGTHIRDAPALRRLFRTWDRESRLRRRLRLDECSGS